MIERRGPDQTSYLVVNAPGTGISPLQTLDVTGAKAAAFPKASLYQELWPLLAVCALLVLLLEWAVYHRAR